MENKQGEEFMRKIKPFKEAFVEIIFNNKDRRMKAKNMIIRFELEEITINPDLTFNGKFKGIVEMESNTRKVKKL